MDILDSLAIGLYVVLQIVAGGLIFNGLKRLIKLMRSKRPFGSRIQLSFLIIGILGLSFYIYWNTIGFIDKF
jgi:hypothetical protein